MENRKPQLSQMSTKMSRTVESYTTIVVQEKVPKYRAVVAAMIFSAAFISSMMMADLPFISVALEIPRPALTSNKCSAYSNESENLDLQTLNLTRRQIGAFISSYFVGNVLTVLSGDVISETLGPVWTVGGFTMLASLMTGIIPYIVHLNFYTALFNRFIVGICVGPMFPSCYKLIINWAPLNEVKVFVYMLSGLHFGALLMWPIISLCITYNGWAWGFLISSAIGLLWSFIWLIFVSNYPDNNFFISQKEIEFIKKSQITSIGKHVRPVPYRAIFTSGPVWAYLIFELGSAWIRYMYIIIMPLCVNDTTAMSLLRNGIYSVLPLFTRLMVGFASGRIYSKLITKLKPIRVQRIFTLISHFIPGSLFIGLVIFECNLYGILSLVIVTFGINGVSLVTSFNNPRGLTSNFCFAVYNYGVIFPISVVSIFVPLITNELEMKDPIYGWNLFLSISAATCFFSGSVFIVKSSGDFQNWDNLEIGTSEML